MTDWNALATDIDGHLNEYEAQMDQIAARKSNRWSDDAIERRRASIAKQRKVVTVLRIISRDAHIANLVAEQMGAGE